MIGQTIEARHSFPWSAALVFAAAAALAAGAAASNNPHLAIAALLPFFVGVALWATRQRTFSAEFTQAALEIYEPPLSIPYGTITWVRAEGRPRDPAEAERRAYAMVLAHEGGLVWIPARLNVASEAVYQFLTAQSPPGDSRPVNPLLAEYLRRQQGAFGPEHVWSYRARGRTGRPASASRARAVWLAVAGAGIAWIGVGALLRGDYIGWAAGGMPLALGGGLVYVGYWLGPLRAAGLGRNLHQASLVISPVGLAMVQGDLKGELRWDEIRSVKLQQARSFVLSSDSYGYRPGIILTVEGAKVFIADIYDQPLSVILERITAYWQESG
ncbi:MAG TPA: hypothetical protein VG013_09960 [Gemmataceae bacterium]|jgi:hypothetical protein|nr:hypothetical protein [Gemmataceae bacterium]